MLVYDNGNRKTEVRTMSEMNDLLCVICGEKTDNIFNINLEQKPICENCANQIALQQIKDLIYKSD